MQVPLECSSGWKVQEPGPVMSTDCNVTFKYCRCICATLSLQQIVAFDFQDCTFSRSISLSFLFLLLAPPYQDLFLPLYQLQACD